MKTKKDNVIISLSVEKSLVRMIDAKVLELNTNRSAIFTALAKELINNTELLTKLKGMQNV